MHDTDLEYGHIDPALIRAAADDYAGEEEVLNYIQGQTDYYLDILVNDEDALLKAYQEARERLIRGAILALRAEYELDQATWYYDDENPDEGGDWEDRAAETLARHARLVDGTD